jgi:hypothetical protein
MFKKYRLYIFAVLVFAAIIIFGITCAAKQIVTEGRFFCYMSLVASLQRGMEGY